MRIIGRQCIKCHHLGGSSVECTYRGVSPVVRFPMRRRLAQILLVILTSLSIAFLSAYLNYRDLAGTDSFACDISFENSDQDNLPIVRQEESEEFLPSALSLTTTLSLDLLRQLPHLFF